MLCIQYYTIFCVKNVGDGKNKKAEEAMSRKFKMAA